jgi:hypothetical protein
MNKLFSLSVIPLATTATVACAILASAPVQAFSLTGDLQITGNSTFSLGSDGKVGGNDDKLTINTASIDPSSTGSFSTWAGPVTGVPLTAMLTGVASNSFGMTGSGALLQAYSGTTTPTSIGFSNGVTFEINSPFEAALFKYTFGPSFSTYFQLAGFSGTFKDASGEIFATGSFTSQGGLGTNSYSISATPVPEPLTIIGSGIALGFGGFLKRKQKAAQNKS